MGLQRRVRSPLGVSYPSWFLPTLQKSGGGVGSKGSGAPKLAGCYIKPLQLFSKAAKTCFSSLCKRVWTSLDIPKSRIFMGGSFKISFSCLNTCVNPICISDRFFFPLGNGFGCHFGSKLIPKSIQNHIHEPKRPAEAPKIDFEARKTHPRPPKKPPKTLPRGSQKTPKCLRNSP